MAFEGASRIPYGADTDTAGDWSVNDFDGFGFPGFPGLPAVGEPENTPGAVNADITVETDPLGECGDQATLIHDMQGKGLASPDVGAIREVEGIVVGDFETSAGGFFLADVTTMVGVTDAAVTYEVTDGCGNATVASAEVAVPMSQGQGKNE